MKCKPADFAGKKEKEFRIALLLNSYAPIITLVKFASHICIIGLGYTNDIYTGPALGILAPRANFFCGALIANKYPFFYQKYFLLHFFTNTITFCHMIVKAHKN